MEFAAVAASELRTPKTLQSLEQSSWEAGRGLIHTAGPGVHGAQVLLT